MLFLVLCHGSQWRKVSPALFQQVHSCSGLGLLSRVGESCQHRGPVPEVCWSWAGSELYPGCDGDRPHCHIAVLKYSPCCLLFSSVA